MSGRFDRPEYPPRQVTGVDSTVSESQRSVQILVQTLVQTGERGSGPVVGPGCGFEGDGLRVRSVEPCEGQRRQRIHRAVPRPIALDRCRRSSSGRSWNDASRLVRFAALLRPCSRAFRRCGEGHEHQPFGRVRPPWQCPQAASHGQGFSPARLAPVNSGVSAGRPSQWQTRLPFFSPVASRLLRSCRSWCFRVESDSRRSDGGFLQSRRLVGKPCPKIGGEISAKGKCRDSLPVLFVSGLEYQGRHRRGVQVHLTPVIEANSPLRSPVSTRSVL